jgi:glycosyltransferase involved in cell wall biosynthesis
MSSRPEISVVCPLFDEQENVRPLVAAIRAALGDAASWEIVLVDDGSRDGTVEAIRVEARDPRVRLVRLARNYGQSTATRAGLDAAAGQVIVTMDGDLQNDPLDIPRLVAKLDEGYDLVVGYRENRQDRTLSRKIPSFVANRLIRAVTGVPIRDNGCSLKAYRRRVADRLGLYSDMHRFIPALAVGSIGAQIAQIPVRHHARRFGKSKYGLSRVWKVLADLLAVVMLRWFQERPLVMFAYCATAALVASASCLLVDLLPGRPGGIVLPGAALLFFGLSIYLLMVGLIAQVAVHLWTLPEGVRSGGAR